MKKYLIICENKKSADKVNDFIAVNSLFTEGETITEPVASLGKSYTDDERVYNAVLSYIQEGGEDVKVYNLRDFVFVKDNIEVYKDAEGRTQINRLQPSVYRVKVNEDSITVNGYMMKLKIKQEFTYKLMKTFVGTSSPETLAHFLQDEGWSRSSFPDTVCKHIIAHGKKYA